MVECNSPNIYPNLNDQQQFRLNKISVTSGSISIASFATVIRAPVRIASASFGLAFSISTNIVKKA